MQPQPFFGNPQPYFSSPRGWMDSVINTVNSSYSYFQARLDNVESHQKKLHSQFNQEKQALITHVSKTLQDFKVKNDINVEKNVTKYQEGFQSTINNELSNMKENQTRLHSKIESSIMEQLSKKIIEYDELKNTIQQQQQFNSELMHTVEQQNQVITTIFDKLCSSNQEIELLKQQHEDNRASFRGIMNQEISKLRQEIDSIAPQSFIIKQEMSKLGQEIESLSQQMKHKVSPPDNHKPNVDKNKNQPKKRSIVSLQRRLSKRSCNRNNPYSK